MDLYTEQSRKISVNDLKNCLNRKDKALMLVDAREITAYYKGHIPGAISLFDGEIIPKAKDLDKNMDIVVYGPGQAKPSPNPMDRLSGDAAERLRSLGLKNVMDLDGGFESWANSGNRIDSSQPESIKTMKAISYEQLKEFLGGMGSAGGVNV